MPRKKASKKALRVSARRATRNRIIRAQLRDAIRKVRTAITAKKAEEAKKVLVAAVAKLDRAAKVHLIQRGRANRLKSRLALLVNKISDK